MVNHPNRSMQLHKFTANARRALIRYGTDVCREAYRLHSEVGYGAAGIAFECGLKGIGTTQQADAAINAGRELKDTARG